MSDTAPPESLVSLIKALQDVPDPAPVSMMPQTQGWIVLAAFLAVGVAFATRSALRRYRANAYRRAGLQALQRAGDDPAQVSAILKRAALVAYPRHRVASLTGPDWLAFLDQTGKVSGFVSGPGVAITAAAYAPQHPDAPGLNALARQWVRQHVAQAAT